jgi:hypothetical protein
MAAELPQPGVEIIQEFRSVSPTILTPTLVPCVVGVAKQIVDLLVDDGSGTRSLNSDAIVTLPGFFVSAAAAGDPPVYGGLDGLLLVISINNGPDITVTFDDSAATGLSPASVVSQISAAFTAAGVTAAIAETVGDDTWQMKTIGVGEFQFIDIGGTTDAAVASAFGIGIGKRYQGISNYNNRIVDVPQTAFPDPRGNLEEILIENDTIRAFVGTGSGGFREALRTTAFCRNGVVDDPAVTTEGSVDLVGAYPAVVAQTLVLKVDGGPTQTVTFASQANATTLLAAVNAQTTGLVASLGSGNGLVLTSDSLGADASIQIVSGSAVVLLGLTLETVTGFSIEAVDDGNGDQLTSLIRVKDEDFTATPTATVVTGSGGTYPLGADGTLIVSDGHQNQIISLEAGDSVADVVTKVNAVMGAATGGRLLAAVDTGELKLTHTLLGTDSIIDIVGGTSLADLGLSVGTHYPTAVSKPEPGDELWVGGVLLGTISQVAPGGEVDQLRIAAQVTISDDIGAYFYIVAKNLPSADPTRPDPDLIVDGNGAVSLKMEQLRNSPQGDAIDAVGPIYIQYTAVRKDVTSSASSPGVLRFDDTTQLEQALSPVNAENPLALGLFFALLNAPGIQVLGLGVDEVSADSPFGTLEGFTRAAEYLEAFEVYALAPLTHEATVHQAFLTHVTTMSGPTLKGERVALVNPSVPTNRLDDLLASGTDGETTGSLGLTFDTHIANLTALVQAASINPVGTIPVDDGLFLDIGSDTKNYSIESITGSVVTIRTTFASGENDDSFYSDTALNDSPLPAALIDEAFSIKVRGASLATVAGRDLTGIAETVAAVGRSYGNRRLWMTFPDSCAATVEGSEQVLEGFYMNAALAGMVGQNPPQQSFTNFPIAGFTRVIGSSDTFNARQMNVMAGGGTWIITQDAQGAPLLSRMALTTDLTSIETRTDSITKVVDYTAKFLRASLRNFIGRFNITQGFLDSLGSVIQGVLGLLVETGVLIGATLNNIIQDEDAPDTVLIDITLDVPFPCNYIRLTLVI